MPVDQKILEEMWKLEQQIKALEGVKNNKGKSTSFRESIQEQIDEKKRRMDALKKKL